MLWQHFVLLKKTRLKHFIPDTNRSIHNSGVFLLDKNSKYSSLPIKSLVASSITSLEDSAIDNSPIMIDNSPLSIMLYATFNYARFTLFLILNIKLYPYATFKNYNTF